MKTPSFIKKSLYSALVFFGTLLVLSASYATWNSVMTRASSGSTLSSGNWNVLVDNIADLDSRWSRNGAAIGFTGGNVGIGTASPEAALDIKSTTAGFLPPRMTTAQRNTIVSPVAGLVVYNTDVSSIDYYNGSSWMNLNGKSQYIKLGMSAQQANPAIATVIAFDTVRYSQGMTSSSNGINLKAGVTYRIEAAVNIYAPTSGMYLGYGLYSGVTPIGDSAFTNSANAAYGFKAQILEFYTPATDQTVQLKVMDNSMGAGVIYHGWSTYFIATVMK